MAYGISGDNIPYPLINGQPSDTYNNIELRVISALLIAQAGTQANDELRTLRNDQAFEIGVATPILGN